MDFTTQIPVLQEQRRIGHGLLRRSRTLLGVGDRVLLAALVSWMEGLTSLVGAATTETEVLKHLQNDNPDLLICTDTLEQGTGISLLSQARSQRADLKILLLLQRPLVRTIVKAIEQGCDGICSAELTGSGTVLAALNAMESDGKYMDRVTSGVLSHGQLRQGGHEASAVLADLSLREEDVLHGLCKGMTNQEIADALTVTTDTVKSHVSSLLRKLAVSDRTQAVVKAFQTGLVDLPTRPPTWTS
ncbi:MAG: response regulator transcription factor [Synechococcus sp.]|nr:response regulator transcription factor [Synechococcus sp.]